MLILVYSHSDNFLSRHEYAITAEGYECICARKDDEAVNLVRTRPVDVIYLHTSSIGKDVDRLIFLLNNFKGSIILGCTDLDNTPEPSTSSIKGLDDTIFTCNDDPRPLISRLKVLYSEIQNNHMAMHDTSLKQASLQTYSINNASFNWGFSCHADIKAIREGDILERITRASQFFPMPVEHHRNILIILTELYNNAIDHGVLELPSELKEGADGFARFYEHRLTSLNRLKTGSIDIKLEQRILGDKSELSIFFKDSGKGFNYAKQLSNEITNSAYGRGIFIINKLSRSIEYSGCGNEVEVIYEWLI